MIKRRVYDDISIAWEVTEHCNHKCFYCYNYFIRDNDIVEKSNYEKITDFIVSQKPVSVAITGGESLLVFDKIKPCIKRIIKNGAFVRLLTNGSLITDEIASFLAENNIQVMVSFPTIDRNQFGKITNASTFGSVVNGVDILKKHNVDFLLNVVINAINLDNMEAIADFLVNRYDVKKLFFTRATKPQTACDEIKGDLLDNDQLNIMFDKCLQIKKKYGIDIGSCSAYAYCSFKNREAFNLFAKGCGVHIGGIVISQNGDVRKCAKESNVYGNVFRDSIETIFENSKHLELDEYIPHECNDCKYRLSCRGGCRMASFNDSPSFKNLDANAVPSDLNPTFDFSHNRININCFAKYKLCDGVIVNEIDGYVRLTKIFAYSFVSKRLYRKLISGKAITFFDIVLDCFSLNKSKFQLYKLVRFKFIEEVK